MIHEILKKNKKKLHNLPTNPFENLQCKVHTQVATPKPWLEIKADYPNERFRLLKVVSLPPAGSVVTWRHQQWTQTAARCGSPSTLMAASQAAASLHSTGPFRPDTVSSPCVCVCKYMYPHIHEHLCSCASVWIFFVFSQRAAPEKSSCATAAAVCCLCLCATVIQTATTNQTRRTAAINTKVRPKSCSNCPFHQIVDYWNGRKSVAVLFIVSFFTHTNLNILVSHLRRWNQNVSPSKTQCPTTQRLFICCYE